VKLQTALGASAVSWSRGASAGMALAAAVSFAERRERACSRHCCVVEGFAIANELTSASTPVTERALPSRLTCQVSVPDGSA